MFSRIEGMPQYAKYECAYPTAYPWNDTRREDVPRFYKTDKGWWENPNAPKSGKALLSCVGDLICEPRLIRAHRYGDTVFYHPLFQFVRPILRQSDLVMGNLETNVTDLTPDAGYYHTVSGKYHCNANESFLEALRYAGFDGFANANNHNCDSGIAGLMETNERLDKHGFFHTGTFLPGDGDRAALVNVNGIRIGILSYAHRFNRLETNFTPLGQTMLNLFSPEKVNADVAWAKAHGAEFILSYVHWGKEYIHYPIDEQLEKAQVLADAGVDYIVGSHSHCLQVNDTVTAADGRIVPVVYSMGNFHTNESKDLCRHSGILQLLLEKTENGIRVTNYFVPCFVFDAFENSRYSPVPADTLHNGGFDHPDLHRTRVFSQELIRHPEPVSGAITAKELCKLFEIPACDFDFPISGICTNAEQILDRQLYFAMEEETSYRKLCLLRRRPILVVATEPKENHKTLVVPDVRKAYHQLMTHLRSRFATKFLTVAGRENKTVTADMIAHTLKSAFRVHHGTGDHNWLFLHPAHDWCVQEVRSSALGYAPLQPKLCVITSYVSDLTQLLESLAANTLVLYNSEDTDLVAALEAFANKQPFSPVSYPGMRLDVAAGAAQAVARYLGIAAPENYRYSGMEQNIHTVKDMTILTDLACKSVVSAKKSLDILAGCPGKKIAVVAESYAPFANADTVISVPAPSEDRPERLAAELALEEKLLAQLAPGCTVLLCADRHHDLNLTLRRVFGLTDGNIYDLT